MKSINFGNRIWRPTKIGFHFKEFVNPPSYDLPAVIFYWRNIVEQRTCVRAGVKATVAGALQLLLCLILMTAL